MHEISRNVRHFSVFVVTIGFDTWGNSLEFLLVLFGVRQAWLDNELSPIIAALDESTSVFVF